MDARERMARGPAWWEDLTTKNTFLDCRSPWVDAEVDWAVRQAEANRPNSDPSSNSSSRSSSIGTSISVTSGSGDVSKARSYVQDIESLLQFVRFEDRVVLASSSGQQGGATIGGDQPSAESPTASPAASLAKSQAPGPAVGIWTPGAEGHEDLSCTPCKFLFKAGSCREGEACNFCHLKHPSGHPKLKLRPCKGKRDRFRKMIQKLQEEVALDGRDVNLDDLDYVLPSVKDNEHLKARLMRMILGEDKPGFLNATGAAAALSTIETAGTSAHPSGDVREPAADDDLNNEVASI